MTALDIITAALQEINVVAQGEPAQSGDAAFALGKLNRLLDAWAARKAYVWAVSFPTFTLVPGLLPHTIGPMGAITATSAAGVGAAAVATYECLNNLQNGQSATVVGTGNDGGALNVTGNVQGATATQFSLPAPGAAPLARTPDAGTVVTAGNPVPTFATPSMGQRPQRVEQATLILTDQTPQVEIPLNIRDSDWWMNQRVKALQSNIPTDLYYQSSWPNGSLYFWPLPNAAYGCRLKLWGAIAQFPSLAYAFSMPPGYEDAVTMSLAKNMAGGYKAQWGQSQEDNLKLAMRAIESNNMLSPRGPTADAGMPGTGVRGGDNNYYSGMFIK